METWKLGGPFGTVRPISAFLAVSVALAGVELVFLVSHEVHGPWVIRKPCSDVFGTNAADFGLSRRLGCTWGGGEDGLPGEPRGPWVIREPRSDVFGNGPNQARGRTDPRRPATSVQFYKQDALLAPNPTSPGTNLAQPCTTVR
jgi:hypothetical protein